MYSFETSKLSRKKFLEEKIEIPQLARCIFLQTYYRPSSTQSVFLNKLSITIKKSDYILSRFEFDCCFQFRTSYRRVWRRGLAGEEHGISIYIMSCIVRTGVSTKNIDNSPPISLSVCIFQAEVLRRHCWPCYYITLLSQYFSCHLFSTVSLDPSDNIHFLFMVPTVLTLRYLEWLFGISMSEKRSSMEKTGLFRAADLLELVPIYPAIH